MRIIFTTLSLSTIKIDDTITRSLYSLIFPLIGLLIGLYCYVKYTKRNKASIEASKYPPNDFDNLELSFLLKGFVTDNDIASLLLNLATSGHLQFIEKDQSFNIVKIKEYKGNNLVKKILMDNLFKEKQELQLSDIEYRFSKVMDDIKNQINNNDNKKLIFEPRVRKYRFLTNIFVIISLILINMNGIKMGFDSYFWSIFVISLMTIIILFIMRKDTETKDRIVLGIIVLGINIYLNRNLILADIFSLVSYIVGTVLIIINVLMYIKLPNRTKYGNECLGKIIGFKSTLDQMKKEELENKLQEEPNYFYNMIPYVYSFGILDKWINKGNNIIYNNPDWYIGMKEFNIKQFKRNIQNIIFRTMQVMLKEKALDNNIVYEKSNRVKDLYDD